jgi:hypothetical protein
MKRVNTNGSIWGLVMLLAVLWGEAASAATVVYEDVGFISGTEYYSHSFTVESAGTYEATLTDFVFPASFSELGFAMTTSTDTLFELDGPGSFQFAASPGTTYYASVFGVAGGALDLGLYGIDISNITAAGVPSVPLPGTLLMMASSLVVLRVLGRGAGSDAGKSPVIEA